MLKMSKEISTVKLKVEIQRQVRSGDRASDGHAGARVNNTGREHWHLARQTSSRVNLFNALPMLCHIFFFYYCVKNSILRFLILFFSLFSST